jgi:hypothetical protein
MEFKRLGELKGESAMEVVSIDRKVQFTDAIVSLSLR